MKQLSFILKIYIIPWTFNKNAALQYVLDL